MTNISLLDMGKIKKRSVRETIISILSREFPLSIKKIYNKVKKEYNLNVTYQAVFKIIKEMIEDNILEKFDKEYKLNISWIKELENEISIIKKNYLNEANNSEEPLQSRINNFISKLGPKIKECIGKDKACIMAVSGGGRLFAMPLFKYLLKEGKDVKYNEINWLPHSKIKSPLFEKENLKNKKLILVDSEIYSGTTYHTVMENFNKIKKKFNIKDIKFVADRDIGGLADFSNKN